MARLILKWGEFECVCPVEKPEDNVRRFIVVRAWGKTDEEMLAWKLRMEDMLAPLVACGEMPHTRIIVVMPRSADPESEMLAKAEMTEICDTDIIGLVVIAPKGWVGRRGWTDCLNAAVAYVANVVPEDDWHKAQIVPMSFDITMDDANAQLFAQCLMNDRRFIGCRSMPPQIMEMDEIVSANALIAGAVNKIRTGKQPSKDEVLAWTTRHRNTLAIWWLPDFQKIGMFNPACSMLSGMEDVELIWRLSLDATTTHSLEFGPEIRYSDLRMDSLTAMEPTEEERRLMAEQRQKIQKEMLRLQAIHHWLGVEMRCRSDQRMNRSPQDAEFALAAKFL